MNLILVIFVVSQIIDLGQSIGGIRDTILTGSVQLQLITPLVRQIYESTSYMKIL